ncbi:hypothetical protein DASC09_054380 [Saccharomycopsis crataegensis]|uniref:Uncharacterized protein n=1 Tax=Saccharomycopsis crataegensis TaxID=43959 RepID=A0AAV5QVH2_9ASCO|nr:hypothetical protein DASC09_054380 [Saccharomycopsis crataegensis]
MAQSFFGTMKSTALSFFKGVDSTSKPDNTSDKPDKPDNDSDKADIARIAFQEPTCQPKISSSSPFELLPALLLGSSSLEPYPLTVDLPTFTGPQALEKPNLAPAIEDPLSEPFCPLAFSSNLCIDETTLEDSVPLKSALTQLANPNLEEEVSRLRTHTEQYCRRLIRESQADSSQLNMTTVIAWEQEHKFAATHRDSRVKWKGDEVSNLDVGEKNEDFMRKVSQERAHEKKVINFFKQYNKKKLTEEKLEKEKMIAETRKRMNKIESFEIETQAPELTSKNSLEGEIGKVFLGDNRHFMPLSDKLSRKIGKVLSKSEAANGLEEVISSNMLRKDIPLGDKKICGNSGQAEIIPSNISQSMKDAFQRPAKSENVERFLKFSENLWRATRINYTVNDYSEVAKANILLMVAKYNLTFGKNSELELVSKNQISNLGESNIVSSDGHIDSTKITSDSNSIQSSNVADCFSKETFKGVNSSHSVTRITTPDVIDTMNHGSALKCAITEKTPMKGSYIQESSRAREILLYGACSQNEFLI